jgi:ATP/maltotriose-dependent transcriptional regulator MalT
VPTTFLGGSTRISLWARAWLARAQFVTGEWEEAVRTVREGGALLDRSGITLVGPLLHWTAVQVHALRGDWELADEALRHTDAGAQDYEIMRVPACLARAQVAEARADYAAVLRALQPLRQIGGSVDEPGQWPWADVYANALVVEGRYDEAEAFLEPHEKRARERGHRSAQARLGYARGRLLGAQGHLAAARRVFEESLGLLEDLPLSYDRARVSFAYGQTLRRAGKRRQADAVLSAARDLYSSLGATTYVARCDRELKAGGVRTPQGDRAIGELTPQEEAVSQLVARGLSNREVAAELFLSTKTVQYHLTRIYAKLGIRSRSELAAVRGPISGSDLHDHRPSEGNHPGPQPAP